MRVAVDRSVPTADDVYIHFLGYALGFLSSYLTVLVVAHEADEQGI